MRWLVAIAIAGCGDNTASIDARPPSDAPPSVDSPPPETVEYASCIGSHARVTIEPGTQVRELDCATSCYLQFDHIEIGRRAQLTLDPIILCAETPALFVGSPCGPTLCLPTRVTLATDGTVSGQPYIACGEELCISRPPPLTIDRPCIGDWECPAQMLCDDLVTPGTPVCKPGPRGLAR